MFWSPTNIASSYLIALLFIHSHIKTYCQIGYNTALSYSVSGMTPLPVNHMAYAHAQPIYHLPQDKTEVIVVGDRGGKQHHHHHHHHHHKNIHHHHHGHKHSHGHNHNHDHKHDHDHKHGHNHNHKHGHNHAHKHDHGHNHQHNHGHGHLHNHGHNHDHKHAHILLHRLLHRQKHSPNYEQIYQQGHNYNSNYKINNVQDHIKSNGYEQHSSDEQVNEHQFKPLKHHNNLQHGNYEANYPDHVSPSYISTENDKGISHNGDTNKVKVHYDEPEQGDVHQSHYEHSASNENASYEPKDDDNMQADHSQSSENLSHKPNTHQKESVDKSVYSSEQGDASPRLSHSNFKNKPLLSQRFRTSPPTKSYSSRYQNTNIPKNHGDARGLKVHDKHSDELSVEPQVHYGVRLQHDDYHKKQASISSVTFLQENGELITVGDDDPLVSVGKPLKLEDSNPQLSYHGESLESKLSAGRMTLTPARDYKASIGKVDEVWNVPLFH